MAAADTMNTAAAAATHGDHGWYHGRDPWPDWPEDDWRWRDWYRLHRPDWDEGDPRWRDWPGQYWVDAEQPTI